MPDRIRRRSLLYYWSIRYFLLLVTVFLVVAVSVLCFIQANALSSQKQRMSSLVRDIATSAAANGGNIPNNPSTNRWLDERVDQYGLDNRTIVIIFDLQGRIISQFPPVLPPETPPAPSMLQDVMRDKPHLFTAHSSQDDTVYQAAVFPMLDPSLTTGYALCLTQKADVLKGLLEFKALIALIFLFILLGWGVIYLMTRRLVKPIRQAADAADQIVAGYYNVQFSQDYKEEEIRELMKSFKEMADQLNRLEELRSQLLAGVTHELKTPITSISGLIQAVKGRVVTGEEADAFLEICLKESSRLQKMIEDLLDFNSFVDSTVTIAKEWCDLDKLIADIVERWRLGQGSSEIEIVVETPDRADGWRMQTDPNRVEQIMINLLNNARDAMASKGKVSVRLVPALGASYIQVHDTGSGIPVKEHTEIFEPFYRGDGKKMRVRGLGIGLTFSRMIAHSLGGDLILSGSIPGSTTFTFMLPFS